MVDYLTGKVKCDCSAFGEIRRRSNDFLENPEVVEMHMRKIEDEHRPLEERRRSIRRQETMKMVDYF